MKDFKKKLAFVSFGVVYWTAAIIAIVWLMFGAGDMFGFPYAFVALIVGFTAWSAGWIKIDQKVWDWKVD